jgi:hypothetical protein
MGRMRACLLFLAACSTPVALPPAEPPAPIAPIETEAEEPQELPPQAVEPGSGWFCHATAVLGMLDCNRSEDRCNQTRDAGKSALVAHGVASVELGRCQAAEPWCYTSFDGTLDCAVDEKTCSEMRDVSGNDGACTQPP